MSLVWRFTWLWSRRVHSGQRRIIYKIASLHGNVGLSTGTMHDTGECPLSSSVLYFASTGCLHLSSVHQLDRGSFAFYRNMVCNNLPSALHDGGLSLNMIGRPLNVIFSDNVQHQAPSTHNTTYLLTCLLTSTCGHIETVFVQHKE